MSRLQKKLKRQQESFNRKFRRLAFVFGAAFVLVIGVLTYVYLEPFGQESTKGGTNAFQEEALSDPTTLSTGDPDDPSQLVLPGLIMSERPANPVTITESGKQTKIDKDILSIVLEAVQKTSQQELIARVDPNVQWVDFTYPEKREQLRGRVCQFRGTLRRFTPTRGVEFPDLSIDQLYEGQVQDKHGRWYSFYCLEEPASDIGRSDLAILTGVYYKLIRYSTRGGKELISPLFIARTLTSRPGPKPSYAGDDEFLGYFPRWTMYVAFTLLTIVICIIIHYLMKRPTQRYKRKKRQ